jgi:hypothetical protein
MKTALLAGLVAGLSLGAAAVRAADLPSRSEDFKTDAPTCAGVYGALADTRGRMAETWTIFKQSNLMEIDYAGRRDAQIKAGGPDAKFGYVAYETNFKVMLVGAIIDKKGGPIGEVLKVAARCDFANNTMPTFAPPK